MRKKILLKPNEGLYKKTKNVVVVPEDSSIGKLYYDSEKAQRRNFYNRYGKYFQYGSVKLTYEQWKAKGCSVRLLMVLERQRRVKEIEKKRGKK